MNIRGETVKLVRVLTSVVVNGALRQVDVVDGDPRLDGQSRRDDDASLVADLRARGHRRSSHART